MEQEKTMKELRAQKGLTLAAVAEALGIDSSYVSYLEHGKRQPSLPIAGKLAEIYEVPLQVIYDLLVKK